MKQPRVKLMRLRKWKKENLQHYHIWKIKNQNMAWVWSLPIKLKHLSPRPCFKATGWLSVLHPSRKQIGRSIHSSARHPRVKTKLSLYSPVGQVQLLSYKGDNQIFLKRNKAMQLLTVYLPTTRLWTRGDFPEISMIVCCLIHYLEDFQVVFSF